MNLFASPRKRKRKEVFIALCLAGEDSPQTPTLERAFLYSSYGNVETKEGQFGCIFAVAQRRAVTNEVD